MKYFLLAAVHIICITAVCDKDYLAPVIWSGGPFVWPDKTLEALYKSSGRYVSKNAIATRSQISDNYAYVAIPRLRPGVPVTLAQVSLKSTGYDAVLYPYPCLATQEEGNCQAMQSVVDIYIDEQDVMWVLDVGYVNNLETPLRLCPPKVLAFSVKTGSLLKTIDLSGLVTQASRLQYILCEYGPHGTNPVIYISDAATRSILVYDIIANRGYRVVLPKAVASDCCRRDVLYIALTRRGCGYNHIVFTYLSSKRVFSIRVDYLRAGSTAGKITDLGLKPEKMVILGTDLGSAIFFRYEGKPEIYRWDTVKCFKPENFVLVHKSPSCYLATQVMADSTRQRMRVLESNFPDFIRNTVGCGAEQQIVVMAGTC